MVSSLNSYNPKSNHMHILGAHCFCASRRPHCLNHHPGINNHQPPPVAIAVGHSSKRCLPAVTTPGDWRWTSLFPWPNDPAINRQLRWTNRNHSSRSEFINCKSVTSHKKHIDAEQGSTAWLFFPPTMTAEHKSDNETLSSRQSTPGVPLLVRKEYANGDLDPNQIPEPVA